MMCTMIVLVFQCPLFVCVEIKIFDRYTYDVYNYCARASVSSVCMC